MTYQMHSNCVDYSCSYRFFFLFLCCMSIQCLRFVFLLHFFFLYLFYACYVATILYILFVMITEASCLFFFLFFLKKFNVHSSCSYLDSTQFRLFYRTERNKKKEQIDKISNWIKTHNTHTHIHKLKREGVQINNENDKFNMQPK